MKTTIKTTAAVALAATISACSPSPETIAPAYVNPTSYMGMSCAQLNSQAQQVTARVAAVTGQQQKAASNDAALTAVTLVLFWPAVFFVGNGDNSAELAQIKGEMQAIQQAAVAKGC